MGTMKNIVFVADIFTPKDTRSSTQLLLTSFLDYLCKTDVNLFFIGIYDSFSNKDLIQGYLDNLGCRYYLFPSKIDLEKHGKYRNIQKLLSETISPKTVFPKGLTLPFERVDKIIASIPSVEAGCIGKVLKRKYPTATYVTMWTDVLAFNLLDDPKRLPVKRLPLHFVEKKLLAASDLVFYLGRTQMEFQRSAFPRYAAKMHYYYPSYYPYCRSIVKTSNLMNVVYFGSFARGIRSVETLCATAAKLPDVRFQIIGRGDLENIQSLQNLEVIIPEERIHDLETVERIENSADVSICYMNDRGFSLPGKFFYFTHLPKYILIIRNGKYRKAIEAELTPFQRYVFCDDEPESIAEALKRIGKDRTAGKVLNLDAFDPRSAFGPIINSEID